MKIKKDTFKVKELLENILDSYDEIAKEPAEFCLTILGYKVDNEIQYLSKNTGTPDGIYGMLAKNSLNNLQVELFKKFKRQADELIAKATNEKDKEIISEAVEKMVEDMVNNNLIIKEYVDSTVVYSE